MVKSRDTRPMLNQAMGLLLREVTKLPDILFVMGRGPLAVMEGWVDSEATRVSVRDDWVAVEGKPWHCHLHLPEVTDVRFVEEPDPHDPRHQAFSIRFLGSDGAPLLMIFFGRMYDDQGLLDSARVERFRALKEQCGLCG